MKSRDQSHQEAAAAYVESFTQSIPQASDGNAFAEILTKGSRQLIMDVYIYMGNTGAAPRVIIARGTTTAYSIKADFYYNSTTFMSDVELGGDFSTRGLIFLITHGYAGTVTAYITVRYLYI